jgi:D-glycero-alpha-D-manno-heptose 1-phosphate guanylyltransferase
MSGFDNVSVVVLAGGRGTRLQGLFPGIPKPMIPIAGQPFLFWLTRWIAKHGPSHFVYSTGYLAHAVERWALDGTMPEIHRESCRENAPLGTGGGLINCLDRCRDWIVVANGDSLVMSGIECLLRLKDRKVDGGLLGVEVHDTSRYGRLRVDENARLTGFDEKVAGSGLINGGVYIFRKELLLEETREGSQSIEYDILPSLLFRNANLSVINAGSAPFIDIGTPETIFQAEQFVREFLTNEHQLNSR